MTLGIVSGLLGNLAKQSTASILIRVLKIGKSDGPTYAAGIFMPKSTMFFKKKAKSVQIIGHVADNIIGAMLGVSAVYLLSFTGKDHYVTKGIGLGHLSWTTMYGFLAKMGATSMYPVGAKNTINSLISHSVFGVVTKYAAVKLGDEGLFKPNFQSLGKPQQEILQPRKPNPPS
ncbi:hypothetical protein DSOL_4166 [Desulfosporosinus metallidurans]|uniref:Uncharacterized protein n=2 Tax=Desulfosporosinus metallidurans TaxID=1888891 RepID=A0A1Q8QLX2_9FIRM|nr:hypothetical protein DSOL_4166 [Desulfosporosinus metallidurans]